MNNKGVSSWGCSYSPGVTVAITFWEPQEVMATVTPGEYEQPQEDTLLLFMFIF